jgi:hypothetical protein
MSSPDPGRQQRGLFSKSSGAALAVSVWVTLLVFWLLLSGL